VVHGVGVLGTFVGVISPQLDFLRLGPQRLVGSVNVLLILSKDVMVIKVIPGIESVIFSPSRLDGHDQPTGRPRTAAASVVFQAHLVLGVKGGLLEDRGVSLVDASDFLRLPTLHRANNDRTNERKKHEKGGNGADDYHGHI